MKTPQWLGRAWPVVASVALLAFAFPPMNLALLVFAGVAPWLASLRDTSARGSLKSGFLFGFLFFLFQMYWLVPFVERWTGRLGTALVPWLVSALLAGIVYAPLGWLIRECWRRGWVWLIPLVWAGHEGFRAYMPVLAFPWAILAGPLGVFPGFVQHAAAGTVFLVSAWALLPNLALAMFVWPQLAEGKPRQPPPRLTLWMAVVFCGLMGLSTVRYAQPPPTERKVVTLGQPGVDMAFTPPEEEQRLLYYAGNLIQSRAMQQGTDLLVFPEGFMAGDPSRPPYSALGPEPQAPVLMGGRRKEGDKTYQTAFAWDGKAWTYADKTRLVVFGEYVPFRGLPILSGFNLPSGDLSPADELNTVTVDGLVVGPFLCFEGVFPDLAERHGRLGARILAQMSIDDWYERTPAWDQLWLSSVWRSIESGLPLVRVGGRGRTLATDVRGNIVAAAPVGQMAALRVELGVPVGSDAFPYRMGFVFVCWAVCLGVVAGALLHGRFGPAK